MAGYDQAALEAKVQDQGAFGAACEPGVRESGLCFSQSSLQAGGEEVTS